MQHPVPPKMLEHIGDITVSFALLEKSIQILIGSLINEHQRIGQIITAELAFKNLRALAISLYKDRYGEDTDFDRLKELMKCASKAEEERNQIMHSFWVTGDTVDTRTRVKTTAKEKDGFIFHFVKVSESDLEEIAIKLKTLAEEIQVFWIHLMVHGKAINNPLN